MSRIMRKPAFCICEKKGADQLISAFVFATQVVQCLYFLNLKFQASFHLRWLYSLINVKLVENCTGRFSLDPAQIDKKR